MKEKLFVAGVIAALGLVTAACGFVGGVMAKMGETVGEKIIKKKEAKQAK